MLGERVLCYALGLTHLELVRCMCVVWFVVCASVCFGHSVVLLCGVVVRSVNATVLCLTLRPFAVALCVYVCCGL